MHRRWKSWKFVRLGLFMLSVVWAADALLSRASASGTGISSLIVPVLALLGFASLSVHEWQALGRSKQGPGASGTAPATSPRR